MSRGHNTADTGQKHVLSMEENCAHKLGRSLGFEGFFRRGGGIISLHCSFSSVAQKHFSERRAHFGDWQFPSLSLQP